MKTQSSIQKVVMTGMLAAVMAVMSQIQFPLPSGVPVTMQTFADHCNDRPGLSGPCTEMQRGRYGRLCDQAGRSGNACKSDKPLETKLNTCIIYNGFI